MTNRPLAEAYIAGWNNHEADAILAVLGPDGLYQDPGTGGPIGGQALKGYVEGLFAVFPDLSFELVSMADTGPDTMAFEWIMRGTNHGSMNGLPPTGKSIELAGSDFIKIAGGHVVSVKGYFDGGAIPRQLGLDIIVQPPRIGPFRFGTSASVQTGKRQVPGAFSITTLYARDEVSAQKVRDGSRESLIDMLGMEGFIGATTGVIGDRMITISAWDDADAPRKVMSQGAHAEAMKGMLSGELATGGFTSVYTLARMNPYLLRCDVCGKMNRGVEGGEDCKHCGAALPERQPYW